MQSIIAVLVVLVTQVSIPANAVEAAPEKRLDNALQADDGSEIIKHLSKMEAAISDNSKSLSSIRQAVQANSKVEAPPEKSLDKALQADAGREIMKHLSKMEAAISDNSKSLSNIRQAVQANTKVEAVPETIHYNKIQADIGDDLMKRLAKIEAAIKSNTEKIGSVESRMITCQVGNLYIGLVFRDKPKAIPIKLTGFKKTPKMAAALNLFELRPGGKGAYVEGQAKSPTSAEITAKVYGGNVDVDATYVACGN